MLGQPLQAWILSAEVSRLGLEDRKASFWVVSISDVLLPLSYLQKPFRVKVQIGSWWEGDWTSGMLLIHKFITFFIPHTLGEGQYSFRVIAGGPEPSGSPGSTWATSRWLVHLTAAGLRSGAQSSFPVQMLKAECTDQRTQGSKGRARAALRCILTSASTTKANFANKSKHITPSLSHRLPLSPTSEQKKLGPPGETPRQTL